MSLNLDSPFYASLTLEKIAEYIGTLTGWSRTHTGERFSLYAGQDIKSNSIELFLPIQNPNGDNRSQIADAIKLLAAAQDLEPLDVAKEIRAIDRDILLERIPTENLNDSTISMKMADVAVGSLYKLILSSARSEVSPSPFLTRTIKPPQEIMERCRFGHTFKGSFGFSVEMPIPPKPPQMPNQVFETPIERKIMQRIVRGIKSTNEAVAGSDPNILVEKYTEGFNADMLSAISTFRRTFPDVNPLYTMRWTKRWAVEKDVRNATEMKIANSDSEMKDSIKVIQAAIKTLKHSEASSETTITGNIELAQRKVDIEKVLGNEDEDTGIDRIVVIDGKLSSGAQVRVRALLTKPDFIRACDALKKERAITIKGKIARDGNRVTLIGAHSIRDAN